MQGLYKKRGVLDGVATQLAPFMLGPWAYDAENVTWARQPLLPSAWFDFQVSVHRRTRVTDDDTTTPIDWWVKYQPQVGKPVFINGSLPISTDIDPGSPLKPPRRLWTPASGSRASSSWGRSPSSRSRVDGGHG